MWRKPRNRGALRLCFEWTKKAEGLLFYGAYGALSSLLPRFGTKAHVRNGPTRSQHHPKWPDGGM